MDEVTMTSRGPECRGAAACKLHTRAPSGELQINEGNGETSHAREGGLTER